MPSAFLLFRDHHFGCVLLLDASCSHHNGQKDGPIECSLRELAMFFFCLMVSLRFEFIVFDPVPSLCMSLVVGCMRWHLV